MFESGPAAEAREEWRRVRHQAVDAGALNIYLQAFDVHAQASREWREHVDSGAGMIIVDQSGNVRANPVYAVVRAAAKSAGVWVAPDAGHVEERDEGAGAEMLRLLRGGGDAIEDEAAGTPRRRYLIVFRLSRLSPRMLRQWASSATID